MKIFFCLMDKIAFITLIENSVLFRILTDLTLRKEIYLMVSTFKYYDTFFFTLYYILNNIRLLSWV